MPRIYKSPGPKLNKAMAPVTETKTDSKPIKKNENKKEKDGE